MGKRKFSLVLGIVIFFSGFAAAAQESLPPQDIYIAPLVEMIGFSSSLLSFGGGVAIGAGDEVALGLLLMYAGDIDAVHTLEMGFFMRFYILSSLKRSGPFVQLDAGASIHGLKGLSLPSISGSFSGGISSGWRFALGSSFYLEPYFRLGYPYIYGIGFSAAYSFTGRRP